MLFIAWRKILSRLTTPIRLLFIKSASTLPAPTGGNWFLSPTIISLQESGKASSSAEKTVTSTIDNSSTITASHSSGFLRLCAKLGSSAPSLNSTSKSLCIVLASLPVSSVILFAALPVGAASATSSPLFSIRVIIPFTVVVLPVPGPPVNISKPLLTAISIACLCFSSKTISFAFSKVSISLGVGGYSIITFIR